MPGRPFTTVMLMTDAPLAVAPSVTAYALDDELVLYSPADGQAYVLNHTAARVWRLLDGTRSAEAIAREIATAYGEPYEQVLADVHELVGQLRAAGLLVDAPGGA